LAQPTPQVQAPASPSLQAPKINVEQNAPPNPTDLNKAAAAAQALSKARSKQSADYVGHEHTDGGGYYITTKDGSRFYCSSSDAKECYNTEYD
jgi:hypothetical protein